MLLSGLQHAFSFDLLAFLTRSYPEKGLQDLIKLPLS